MVGLGKLFNHKAKLVVPRRVSCTRVLEWTQLCASRVARRCGRSTLDARQALRSSTLARRHRQRATPIFQSFWQAVLEDCYMCWSLWAKLKPDKRIVVQDARNFTTSLRCTRPGLAPIEIISSTTWSLVTRMSRTSSRGKRVSTSH